VAEYAWLTYAPKQCGTNPWQQDPQDNEGGSALAEGELRQVASYFFSKGITIDQLGLLTPAEPRFVCLSCSCARGDTLLVQAKAGDAARLVAEFGFTRVADKTLAAIAPVQCGGNPWQQQGAADATELENVVTWATGAGATLTSVGFVYRTELRFHCLACSCSRGDLLVTGGEGLAPLGFVDLYRP
jgi:hypothetical protein